MTDRVATKPGRIKLTNDVTGEVTYYRIEMADEPSNAGTALNKANFLTDQTAQLIRDRLSVSLPDTVNTALNYLASKELRIVRGTYTGNIQPQQYKRAYSQSLPEKSSVVQNVTLTFPFEPIIVFVSTDALKYSDARTYMYAVTLIKGTTRVPWGIWHGTSEPLLTPSPSNGTISWSGNSVIIPAYTCQIATDYPSDTQRWWEVDQPLGKLNATYYYVALG